MGLINFAWENIAQIGAIILAIVGVAEMIVRLTPTEKDDGFVQRVGSVIKFVLDALRIPNIKK